ncbi:hypothetical protein QFC22_001383 [Naganishia vaughanmartiniae]|uniref:Uncharacterized protein n=1 Tax=Naganishia vaughanmartiniae TaxID=1424756 RepID=A0ACC2XGN9_9TREE|nr:hypothetical protein QFC22_001383 [Naganishia vaughanmartiniae]
MASSLQHIGKGALRVAKNYTKGYSDTQTKLRDATSNDPWGPSGTQMNELAQLTYNQNDFVEIMEMLDKRLNDKGKNWRHVFKALTLIDYFLHAGSENVVIYFKDNIYIIKTLKEFVYVDEEQKDVGANVRQKAKDITNLLQDDDRLRRERRSQGAMRDRMLGGIAESGLQGDADYGDRNRDEDGYAPRRERAPPASRPPPSRTTDEDEDLKRAIEASKRDGMNDDERRRAREREEEDLRKAIALSEEEEEKRRKALEEANAKSLFDDTPQVYVFIFLSVTQSDGQLTLFADFSDQFAQQQMPMNTGWMGDNWGQQQMQPQYTGFNPFMQQQMMQQQQQQQQEEFMRQQMMLAEQERQRQEWLQMQQQQQMMQQQQQQQALMAQPTGYRSNNPFAPMVAQHTAMPAMPSPQIQPQPTPQPALPPQPTYTQPVEQPKPAAQPKDDGKYSNLAQLLANRDGGIDTFGNVGNMRIPVGSTFHPSNRLAIQQTGMQSNNTGSTNPFGRPSNGSQQQQGQSDQPFFQL